MAKKSMPYIPFDETKLSRCYLFLAREPWPRLLKVEEKYATRYFLVKSVVDMAKVALKLLRQRYGKGGEYGDARNYVEQAKERLAKVEEILAQAAEKVPKFLEKEFLDKRVEAEREARDCKKDIWRFGKLAEALAAGNENQALEIALEFAGREYEGFDLRTFEPVKEEA